MKEELEGAIWREEQLEDWKFQMLQILTLMPLEYSRLDEIEAYLTSSSYVSLCPYPKYNPKGYWSSTINGLFPEDLSIFLFFCEEKGAMRNRNYDFGHEKDDFWSFAYDGSEIMKDVIDLSQCLIRAYALLAPTLIQLRFELKENGFITREQLFGAERKLVMMRSELWNDHILQISANSPLPKIIPISEVSPDFFFNIESDAP
ncbi:MAG: hypothetical protein ACFFBD_30005 [Candidatus Hodarchaeota archaeon]